MKSRISFFDKTLFRKNLTRFAPAWGLYTLCMFMGLFLMLDSTLARNMLECVQIMSLITPCYALITGQLLFGDLFSSRMCYSIHALPLRRETLFFTNLASGLVFHLIPTCAMAPVSALILEFTSYSGAWISAMGWLLGVNLQYLCFFGIAVLSAQFVGSRFAMAVVYGILNFGAWILSWMVDSLYLPMFFGMQLDTEPFFLFSPMVRMTEESFLNMEYLRIGETRTIYGGVISLGGNFAYYFLCAGAGLVMLGLALQLYRKRELETAGDFIAAKGLSPVFHVVYALLVGTVFSFVTDQLFGYSSGLVFLYIGLVVGWFTGRMLLLRTIRVFGKKGWLGCGALLIAFTLTLGLADWDPLGWETWVPKAEDIRSVTVSQGHYTTHRSAITLESSQEISQVLNIHQLALEQRLGYETLETAAVDQVIIPESTEVTKEAIRTRFNIPITIEYQLKNGRTVRRCYYVTSDTPEGKILHTWFSSARCVFGGEVTAEDLLSRFPKLSIEDTVYGNSRAIYNPEMLLELYRAVLADCQAGTMVQDWDFHYGQYSVYWLHHYTEEDQMELTIFADCENTLNWLRQNGFNVDEILELRGK